MINIKLVEKPNLKDYTFLEGFPGAGLVGPMAISYIIEKLKMDYIGYIESDQFPPLVAIHDNKPMPPIRIYYSEKNKIAAVLAEFAIPIETTYELTEKLYDFIKASGMSKIVSIGGIPSQPQHLEEETVFAIASTDQLKKDVQKAGLNQVGEGVATGVSALLMLKAVMDGMKDINVLVPVDPNILDPKYAELAIISLNKLISLGVDVKELEKESQAVEAKIRDILKRNREAQESHKKATGESGPSAYA
jgi:uncharacterized protein